VDREPDRRQVRAPPRRANQGCGEASWVVPSLHATGAEARLDAQIDALSFRANEAVLGTRLPRAKRVSGVARVVAASNRSRQMHEIGAMQEGRSELEMLVG
jgi:hypothetical protein